MYEMLEFDAHTLHQNTYLIRVLKMPFIPRGLNLIEYFGEFDL